MTKRRIETLKPRVTTMLNTLRTDVLGERGNSAERGYDHAWRKLRLRFLREHPLCECEDCQAGKLRVTGANVVDHIQSIAERPDLRLEWTNLRAMNKHCHDKHTARTQGYGRSRGKR